MPIRVLEPAVAAQIAAGEVVERPASVVKELLENALDAGATRIAIEVRGGGLREIKIQDNGSGIASDEVELAFARQATSKLRTADDLWSLHSLGFRGEALPSIASVAQVACITRTADEEVGTELRIAGSEVQARIPRGAAPGTTISVRNLFYNAPVRREFLRSDATESGAISTIVTQYALAYPEVRFSLLIDDRLALQTSGGGDLREAVIDIYGLDVGRQLLPIEANYGEGREAVRINGLVSPPGVTRSSRGYLHVFVNRRAIAARGAIAAVIEDAYHTLLMRGRHPLAVIDLRIHPASVDVNVHPTKSEVKFRDSSRVLGVLGRAIRDALIESGARPWTDSSTPAPFEVAQRRFELRRIGDQFNSPPPTQHREVGEPNFVTPTLPLEELRPWVPNEPQSSPDYSEQAPPFSPPSASSTPSPSSQPSRLPPLRIVGQINQTYIIAEAPDGMYLIDQHAAHERITYERLMARDADAPFEQQGLLVPLTVDLPPTAQELLLGNATLLAEWGFEIDDFGTGLRVRSVPTGLPEANIATALLEIADHLAGRGGSTPAQWREAMLTTLACHSSVRAGQTLSHTEMRELIEQLERCHAPRTCPHGRPTMILLTHTQLERQFGRIS
jgi:DNA mismatch repair protein MutL